MKQSGCAFFIVFNLLSCSAMAQWAWTDEEGRAIFTDRAPSSSVPDSRIFKRPSSPKWVQNQEQTPNMGAGTASAPQGTGLDKALADLSKKTELAQVEQRKLEDARISKLKADHCERAKQALRTIESGVRLSQTNAQGEREILSDAARTAETKRLQSILVTDCK